MDLVAMTDAFHSPHWHRVAELTPKLRHHVRTRHHRYRGRSWYVLHDPSTGKVHRFTPVAYAVLTAFDGETTVDSVWQRLAADLEADAPSQDEVVHLLAQLYDADLLQGRHPPDAHALQHHVLRHRRRQLVNAAKHPLSVVVPLFDADPFLSRHVGKVRALFTGMGLAVWCAVVLPALVLAALYARELATRFAEDQLSAANLALLAVVFPVMKLIHEAGHAFALKAFGGAVHRTGLILVALLPMPYVDASSAAMLPSKTQRCIVGAAGMMAELLVAAIALYVWLAVEPGLVRDVAFGALVVAALSVLAVNANPLLRLDGYYILTDLAELPNLAQRSSKYWSRRVGHWVAGVRDTTVEHDTAAEQAWFFCYGPLAFVYRIVILLGLALWVASEYLVAGALLAVAAVASGLVWPALKGLGELLRRADSQGNLRQTRLRLSAGAGGLALAALFLPLPLATSSEGIIVLPEESYVRAKVDGFVRDVHAGAGQRVDRGSPIVTGENLDLTTAVAVERARIEEMSARLLAEQFADRVAAEITRGELAAARDRLEAAISRAGQLRSTSHMTGTVVGFAASDLSGRFFSKGETIAIVRPDTARTVRVMVRQADVELVRHRLAGIRVILAADIDTVHRASLVREVPAAARDLPSRALTVAGGGKLPEASKDDGEAKSSQRVFQIDVELAEELNSPAFGSRAYVRFDHLPEPLAAQAYRRLRQLMLTHFDA